MKFSIKEFFSKCDQIHMVTFTEEIFNGKLHFLRSISGNCAFPQNFRTEKLGEIAIFYAK